MNLWELLLWGVAGWTIVGVLGVTLSLLRRERTKAVRGAATIGGVLALYLTVLAGVSLVQQQKVVGMGQEQCFDDMCFAVTGVEEVPGFLTGGGSRLLRVSVQIRNKGRGKAQSESLIRAWLADGQGRRWEQSPGVGGVRLTAMVAAGGLAVSEPIFKVADDATGLGLVFTHGWRQPNAWVIGDSDSLLHRPAIVRLKGR